MWVFRFFVWRTRAGRGVRATDDDHLGLSPEHYQGGEFTRHG
jgi:hypothetical protein